MDKYSYTVLYRVVKDSQREKALIELSKSYGLDIGCRLIDRCLTDSRDIILERRRKEAELAEKKKQIADEEKKLYGG